MTVATLDVRSRPNLAAGARVFVIDCPHGTTRAVLLPGGGGYAPTEAEVVLALIASHEAAEGCGCCRRLRERWS